MKKKILSIILTLMMVVGMIPVGAIAVEDPAPTAVNDLIGMISGTYSTGEDPVDIGNGSTASATLTVEADKISYLLEIKGTTKYAKEVVIDANGTTTREAYSINLENYEYGEPVTNAEQTIEAVLASTVVNKEAETVCSGNYNSTTINYSSYYAEKLLGAYFYDPSAGNKTQKVCADGFELTREKYSIEITSNENGKVETDVTSSTDGEKVTVTVTPDEGYKLKEGSLKATYNDGGEKNLELTVGEGNTYTFTMPAYPVTVTAKFISEFTLRDIIDTVSGTYTFTYTGTQDIGGVPVVVTYTQTITLSEDIVIMETLKGRGGEKEAEKTVIDRAGTRTWRIDGFTGEKPVYGSPYSQYVEYDALDGFWNMSVAITEAAEAVEGYNGKIVVPAGAYYNNGLGIYIYDKQNGKTQKLCMEITEDESQGIVLDRTGDAPKVTPDYFYVESASGTQGYIIWTKSDTLNNPDLEYSADGKTWKNVIIDDAIDLPANGKVYFRGNNPEGFSSETGDRHIFLTCTVNNKVGGDLSTLMSKSGNVWALEGGHEFKNLFSSDTKLTDASALVLPAEILSDSCYAGMFYDCSALTAAPKLPATTLTEGCYEDMFYGCTSLNTVPALPATELVKSCYEDMFHGCISIKTAPSLPATKLADSCYAGMFSGCTSLAAAPELPATELAEGCYAGMFSGCSKLNSIKVGFTSFGEGAPNTTSWLSGVASSGTFFAPADFDRTYVRGKDAVPVGWMFKGMYRITVSISNEEHGTVTVPTSAIAGDTVTVTAVPDEGYAIKDSSLDVVPVDTTQPAPKLTWVEGNIYTFIMPDYDVSVEASFVEKELTLADIIDKVNGTYIGETDAELGNTLNHITYKLYVGEDAIIAENIEIPIQGESQEKLPQPSAEKLFIDKTGTKGWSDVDFKDGKPIYGDPTYTDSKTMAYYLTLGISLSTAEDVEKVPIGSYYFDGMGIFFYDIKDGLTQKINSNDRVLYRVDNVITVIPADHGTVKVKPSANEGDEVTVTVTPDEGYKLKEGSLKATYIDGTEKNLELTQGEGGTYTFVMPDAKVTVTAEFEKLSTPHSITVASTDNGTVTVNPSSACEGDEVTVTVTPNEGYVLSMGSLRAEYKCITWNVIYPILGESNTYTFIMPDYDVTVSAAFEEADMTLGDIIDKIGGTYYLNETNGSVQKKTKFYLSKDRIIIESIMRPLGEANVLQTTAEKTVVDKSGTRIYLTNDFAGDDPVYGDSPSEESSSTIGEYLASGVKLTEEENAVSDGITIPKNSYVVKVINATFYDEQGGMTQKMLMGTSVLTRGGDTPDDPDHEHTYGEPTYIWHDGLSHCTAIKTCTCGNAVIETVNTATSGNKITADFSDAFTDQEKTVEAEAHVHTPELVNGQAATCTSDGWKDYYKCSDNECNKLFSDTACKNEISDLDTWKTGSGKIAKKGHNTVQIPKQDATTEKDGVKAYWYCGNCKQFYTDNSGNMGNLIGDATALYAWKTGDGKIEKLTPVHAHIPELVNGQAATCTSDGWKDYYKCSDNECDKLFSDPACKNEISDLDTWKTGSGKIAKKGHNTVQIPKQDATTEKDGVKAYWYCGNCKQFYTDNSGNMGNLIGDATALYAWKTGDGKIEKLSPESPHEHSFSDSWTKNACAHWHESTCTHDGYTVLKDFEAHNFDSGEAVDGGTKYTCNTCGYIKTVSEAVEVCTHENLSYVNNGNGTHKVICDDCTETVKASEACVYNRDGGTKCICGAVKPEAGSVKVGVTCTTKMQRKYVGLWPLGYYKNSTSYIYTIKTTANGVRVSKVEYKLNGRWYSGSTLTSNVRLNNLEIRVTDTGGVKYVYKYDGNRVIEQ